jgi:hypothetical protein
MENEMADVQIKVSKKTAQRISELINTLCVYTTIVDDAVAKADTARADRAMTRYNEAGKELISAGIDVVLYKHYI